MSPIIWDNISLQTTRATSLKLSTAQASSLKSDQKYALEENTLIDFSWYRLENNHYYGELTEPLHGRYNWYVFAGHVQRVDTYPSEFGAEGLALKKHFEGFHKDLGNGFVEAYWDNLGGLWTIGNGLTGKGIRNQTVWSYAEHDAHLLERLKEYINAAKILKLPKQYQLDAAVSFCFNVGVTAFCSSSFYRNCASHNYLEAADNLLLWNKSGQPLRPILGISRRRAAERELFLGNDWTIYGDTKDWVSRVRNVYSSQKLDAGL